MFNQRLINNTAALACAAVMTFGSTVVLADQNPDAATKQPSQDTLSQDLEQFERSHGDMSEAARNRDNASSSSSDGAAASNPARESERVKALSGDVDAYYQENRSSMEGHRAAGNADSSSAPAQQSERSKAISKDLDEYYKD